MVDVPATQIREQRLQQLHAVLEATSHQQVESPDGALAEQLAQAGQPETLEVRIADLGQAEHQVGSIWTSASRPKWSEAKTWPAAGWRKTMVQEWMVPRPSPRMGVTKM